MENKTKHIGITAVITFLLAIGMFSLIGCATTTLTAKDYMGSGDYWFREGNYENATFWYNRILEVYPNSPEAQTAQEKLAEAQRRKEQLAERDKAADEKRQQEAAQQQARAQAAAAAELRGNIRLFSAYKGTVLLNGEETKFTAEVTTRPGVYTNISVENAKDKEFTVAVRDSAGKVYQAKSKVLFEKTGNYNAYTVDIPDANGKYPYTPNPESDFRVTVTADGKGVVITRYVNNRETTVIIPAAIQGMPVREIEGGAFQGEYGYGDPNSRIDMVIIPAGFTRIAGGLFNGLRKLSTVEIPGTVTVIGRGAFADCNALSSINLPAGLKELGDNAFRSSGISSFPRWPAGITTIPENTFARSNLGGELVIPEGVTRIGSRAFENCRGLTSLSLPSTIRRIDGEAFENCLSLTAVNIPASVGKIEFGHSVFSGSSKIPLASQAALRRVGYTGDFDAYDGYGDGFYYSYQSYDDY